jgi:uncharacterized protein (DUF1501 family)
MSKVTRRDFIKHSSGAIGAGLALPILNREAEGSTIVGQYAETAAGDGNILVVVELAGGIDGLNVIVPYAAYDTYKSLRPSIAIPKDLLEELPGSTTMRMAPELALGPRALNAANAVSGLKSIADAGKLAVIQAVGYPTPNLSHFTSRDIWYSATINANISTAQRTGWLGRHAVLYGTQSNALDMVNVGGAIGLPLYATGATAAGISTDSNGNPSGYSFQTDGAFSADRNNKLAATRTMDAAQSNSPYTDLWEAAQINAMDGADKASQAAATYSSTVVYPANSFAYGLKMIARLAQSTSPSVGTRVYYISTGGFDTHANQANYTNPAAPTGDLPRLLGTVIAPGLKAFYDDIVAKGLENKVTIMLWSEFGRRVAQNNSGTDHGEGSDVILMGGQVRGGFYGADPSLTDLNRGNLKFKIDFRQVYTTLINRWLGGDAAAVLGGTFTPIDFLP